MSRLQQDTFIDEDEEETCPLCVEELDAQDRNFRPCPCGYQICQFCFNNIKQNLNNLCPACRREYREETMQYTPISADELKAEESKKRRAASEKRKMEAQKRELDALNKKHLAGMRVIQRNLVYVTGLNPTVEEERLLQTLRGPEYFGQYGKIIKIVVNKRTAQSSSGNSHYRDHDHQSQGLGVYVTFSNKAEAELCIKAVDGSVNGDRTLRATYGTTKYCSAYLRNETCTNKHCMFLHEAGEDAESFSRMELSTANSRQTREQAHAQLAPPPRATIAAAAPSNDSHPSPMARSSSHVNDDSSALPSTANWAKNPPTPATRPASLVHQHIQPPKTATPSPKIVPASPLPQPSKLGSGRTKGSSSKANGKNVGVIGQKPEPASQPQPEPPAAVAAAPPPKTPVPPPKTPVPPPRPEEPAWLKEDRERWENMLKVITDQNFGFNFDVDAFSAEDYQALLNVPPMWDKNGGAMRRQKLNQMSRKLSASEGSQADTRAAPSMLMGMTTGSAGVAPPPMGVPSASSALQQQRETGLKDNISQLPALQALQHESLQQHAGLRSQTPQGLLQQASQGFTGFQSGPSGIGLPQQQQGHQAGHARQSSRYTFANDAGSATTQVNARGNAAHMAEQIRMMPPQQQQLSHLYGGQSLSSGMLGTAPPPGLKSAPTPPAPGLGGIPMGNVPGMGQFSGMGLAGHPNKEHNEALIRELLGANAPRMGGVTSGLMRGMDGKRNVPFSAGGAPGFTNRRGIVDHLADPSILQARVAQPQSQLHQQGIQAGGHGQPGSVSGPSSTQNTVASPAPSSKPLTPILPLSSINETSIDDSDFPALSAPPKPASTPKSAVVPVATTKKAKEKVDVKGKGKASSTEAVPAAAKTIDDKPIIATQSAAEKAKTKEKETTSSKKRPVQSPEITASAAGKKEKNTLASIVASETTSQSPPSVASPSAVAESPKKQSNAPAPVIRIVGTSTPKDIQSAVSSPSIKPASSVAFSDTASIGTVPSRPVSPPAQVQGKKKDHKVIGPASADIPPAPVKSKSALKKERQAALREEQRKAAEEVARLRAEEAEKDTHEPVVGRKKKDKKKQKAAEKAAASAAVCSLTGNASSAPVTTAKTDKAKVKAPEPVATTQAAPSPKIKSPNATEEPAAATPAQETGNTPSQAAIIEALKVDGFFTPDLLMFQTLSHLPMLTSEDIARIRASMPPISPSSSTTSSSGNTQQQQKPIPILSCTPHPSQKTITLNIRGGGQVTTSMAITPGGQVLRGLTPEKEARYEELEDRLRRTDPELRWHSNHSNPSAAASLSSLLDASGAAMLEASYNAMNPGDQSWKTAVTAHTLSASLAAAGSVARNLHLSPEEAARLSTKDALDYLLNMVMPALPGYAQEHLEGLAQSMQLGGCRVSVGFDGPGAENGMPGMPGREGEGLVTVDVKVDGVDGMDMGGQGSGARTGGYASGVQAGMAMAHTMAGMAGMASMGQQAMMGMEMGARHSVKEWEKMVAKARKETEALEKKVEKLIKRNRKIVGLV